MPNPSEAADRVGLIRCSIGGRTYCLDVSCVRGLQRSEQLMLAAGQDGQLGWIDSKGERFPPHPMAALLSAPSPLEARPDQLVVLLHAQERSFGIAVDQVLPVIWVPRGDLAPLPDIAQDPATLLFQGVAVIEGQMVLRLAVERIRLGSFSSPPAPATPAPDEARPSPHATAAPGKILVFSTPQLDKDGTRFTFALSLRQVAEILLPLAPMPVPAAPAYVLGIIPWRERPVPVLDLEQRLGGALPSAGLQRPILVARASARPQFCGIPIHPDVRIESLPLTYTPDPRKPPFFQRFVKGVFQRGQERLILLDVDRILAAEPR